MKLNKITEKTISTDCRQETGITVGLVDGIIAQIRILRQRDLKDTSVREVFADLGDDEDFKWLYDKTQKFDSD